MKTERTELEKRGGQCVLGVANYWNVELSTNDHTPEFIAQKLADKVLGAVRAEIGWAIDSLALHGAKTDADRLRRTLLQFSDPIQ